MKNRDEFKDKVYVMYDKDSLEIIVTAIQNKVSMTPEEFLKNRFKVEDACKGRNISDFDIIVSDKHKYNRIVNNTQEYKLAIDRHEQDIAGLANKVIRKNRVYLDSKNRRDYSIDDIREMYFGDYLDFNLRNMINAGVTECRFIPLNDIGIRSHMLNRKWKYFYSDPFLDENAKNKLDLGRDIRDNGMYWPVVVAPLTKKYPDALYVYEGNHRVLSLKLLQSIGELPSDYEMLSIVYKINYEEYQNAYFNLKAKNHCKLRNNIDSRFGYDEIIKDNGLEEANLTIENKNGYMINDYTFEYTGLLVQDYLFSLQSYPHWLRDLIYPHKDIIQPSKIINDKDLYKEWLDGKIQSNI